MYKRQGYHYGPKPNPEVAQYLDGKTIFAKTVNAGKKAAPVSYTHLRAHETVLDLVCRLLLEKKNPTTTNTTTSKQQTTAKI